MWQMFTQVMPETTQDQSRCALILLGIVGSIEPNILISNINVLVEHGFNNQDMKMVHDTCLALSKIGNCNKSTSPDVLPFRLEPDHELFEKLETILMENVGNPKDDQYIPMAKEAINVIYTLSDMPDKLAGNLGKKLAMKLSAKPKSGLLLRR